MNKNSIWWRLPTVAYWLTILSLLGLLTKRVLKWDPPLELLVPLFIAFWLPNLCLTAFSLWHWKYRYRGSHPVAWALLFPFFWGYLPALLYYGRHIDADRKGKKQYVDSSTPTPPHSLPGRYSVLRSISFVLGGALLVWATCFAVIMPMAYWATLCTFDERLPELTGKVLTAGEIDAFHIAHRINNYFVGALCAAAIAGALGGILLALSFSIRWRMKEHAELPPSNSTPDGLPQPPM